MALPWEPKWVLIMLTGDENISCRAWLPSSLVNTALSKATNIPRLDTLRDPVSSTPRLNQTPLVLTHHPFNFSVRDVILKNFHILQNDPQTSIFSDNTLVSFRHNKNIRDTLVHSSLQTNCSKPNGTFPCDIGQCKTCSFTDSSTVISAPTSQFFIRHHFTCISSNLIYCISCSKSGLLCIAETGRSLRVRFGEHRRSVINCVSDMKILAVCPISGSNDSRKRQEMHLIHSLGALHPSGINERLSFI